MVTIIIISSCDGAILVTTINECSNHYDHTNGNDSPEIVTTITVTLIVTIIVALKSILEFNA